MKYVYRMLAGASLMFILFRLDYIANNTVAYTAVWCKVEGSKAALFIKTMYREEDKKCVAVILCSAACSSIPSFF